MGGQAGMGGEAVRARNRRRDEHRLREDLRADDRGEFRDGAQGGHAVEEVGVVLPPQQEVEVKARARCRAYLGYTALD